MSACLPRLARGRGRTPLLVLLSSLFFVLSILFSACGGTENTPSGSTPTAGVTVTPVATVPASAVIKAGTLTVGSDTTYAPQEFVDEASNQAVGFDIDLIKAIGERIGLKVEVQTANFSTIVDDLYNKRYDVAISALTINDERKQKADFVPYFNAGQSLLVQKGNPEKITTVKDLCGKNVGVQTGTVELDGLNAASKDCEKAGKAKINLTILDAQTDVIQLLVDKRVVASYQDSPVTDYYLQQHAELFEVAGTIVDAAPEGIAVRKGNTDLLNAIQKAFDAIKADGTYDKLFTKWHLDVKQKV